MAEARWFAKYAELLADVLDLLAFAVTRQHQALYVIAEHGLGELLRHDLVVGRLEVAEPVVSHRRVDQILIALGILETFCLKPLIPGLLKSFEGWGLPVGHV